MAQGKVRIIAGEWRGRMLSVPNIPDVRPTPDRVRETLFNWLAPTIAGARCLDLFAGSGVLGFEALSRGATSVVFVDESPEVVRLLQSELARFKAKNAVVYKAKVPEHLQPAMVPFDVVFLDPPYQAGLLLPTCQYLEKHGFLSEGAYVYLEASTEITDNDLPSGWHLLKSRKAGQVAYHLAVREVHNDATNT